MPRIIGIEKKSDMAERGRMVDIFWCEAVMEDGREERARSLERGLDGEVVRTR